MGYQRNMPLFLNKTQAHRMREKITAFNWVKKSMNHRIRKLHKLLQIINMEITCESDFTKLTVAILKKELESRELDTKGKKADLIERLTKYLQSNKESSPIASKQHSPSKTETFLSPAKKVAAISPTLPSPTNVVDTKEPPSPIKNQNENTNPDHIKKQSEILQKKEISSPVKSKETMSVKRSVMESSPAPKKARLEAFTAIHLEKFTRPLNMEALREKLSDYGEIEKFWMNKIRSISYIVVFRYISIL